jgi:hypothetical protein
LGKNTKMVLDFTEDDQKREEERKKSVSPNNADA